METSQNITPPITPGDSQITSPSLAKPKQKLTRKAKIWIIVAAILGIGVVVAVVIIGITSHGGEDGCPPGENRSACTLLDQSECPCLTPEQKEWREAHPVDEKPIIYLYPETSTEVSVTLGHPEKLIVSYPGYENGWHVLAEPDGRLTDLATGRELYGLYWEGSQSNYGITSEGFIVKGSDAATFLEEKLAILGLNQREAEEFIIYWLPKLQENDYNYIRFATAEEIETYMPLNVTPAPDTIIRILMVIKPLETPIEVTEQQLAPASARSGFTVIEWGGTIQD